MTHNFEYSIQLLDIYLILLDIYLILFDAYLNYTEDHCETLDDDNSRTLR